MTTTATKKLKTVGQVAWGLPFGDERLVTVQQLIDVMKLSKPEAMGERYDQWVRDIHGIITILSDSVNVDGIRKIYYALGMS